MHDYFAAHLALDRQRDLNAEATRQRLAAAANRRQPRTAIPVRPRGMRAQLRMILGRSAA